MILTKARTHTRSRYLLPLLVTGLVSLLSACGGDSNGGNATATPTVQPTTTPVGTSSPQPTATRTPTDSTSIRGLVVVNRSISGRTGERLAEAPAAWKDDTANAAFDKALGFADWAVVNQASLTGTTGEDGRFEIPALAPGHYILELTKTLDGNLLSAQVPFTVGSSGATVVAEVTWGLVRSVSTYDDDGVEVRDVRDPYGRWLISRDGHITELGDGSLTLSDPDGDGLFDVTPCVADCESLQITGITVSGSAQLVLGETGAVNAVASLSSGDTMDVTTLVEWASSNDAVASVDAFGSVTTHAVGTATLSATLGDIESNDWSLTVAERPPLRTIFVQNVNCYYPLGDPRDAVEAKPPVFDAPAASPIWLPNCNQVVRIGATITFRALGEFGDGSYYQDITDEVTWQLSSPSVGSVTAGVFTAVAEGTTNLTAMLGGITSDPSSIRVVVESSVVSISIYPDQGGYVVIFNELPPTTVGRAAEAVPEPCLQCGYTVPVLQGDTLHFHATAHYDTGEWQDVTPSVTWRTSDASIATIDGTGAMLAVAVGTAIIDASLESVDSNQVTAHVVSEATLQYMYLQQESTYRVVVKGNQLFFHALGSYDLGFQRDVTTEATWHSSSDAVGSFDSPGVFTGHAAGSVQVWAEIGSVRTESLTLEVYETSDVTYCDPNNINRGVWSDDFNRVTLESDCASYTRPGVATLRYSVIETQPHGGIFDPCLDLYVYQADKKVRTLREEGCGTPFLPSNAPEYDDAALKYQLRAFWDLKDEDGQVIAPGTYTVFGRFYLYYDPVVSIDLTIN